MTTIETHAEAAREPAVASFLAGVGSWAVTNDHKRIGRIYLGFGLLGLLATTVLGVLLGIERASDTALFDSGSLLQIFQAERVALVFGGIVPLTLGLAIAVVPLQLGARQIAFPRLALTGCYTWLGGLALTFAALVRNGGAGGGDSTAVDLFLAAHGLMVVGLLASAGCVAASVLTVRAPGMTMRRVPLFAWSALIGALGMLVALPILLGAVIYLFVDHRLGISANFGGSEGIGEWIGWAYSVPAVIVFSLPAVGVAAELIPVTFKNRQVMRGQIFAGIALVGVAAFAVVSLQRVHEVSFDTSQNFSDFFNDLLPFLIFACLPILGLLIVFGLGGLTAKGGLANGRPRISGAFVLATLGVGLVFLGVVANAAQSITEFELVGTIFEEGATLLVVYGSAMAVFAGVVFWAPKLWGRVVPEAALFPIVLLALGGAVLAAVPLLIAGFLDEVGGLPVNDAQVSALLNLDYDSSGDLWNWLSLIGHGLMALAVLLLVALMLKAFTGDGEAAPPNPFGAHTIEWSTTSPAPADNFDNVPTVASPSPLFVVAGEGGQP